MCDTKILSVHIEEFVSKVHSSCVFPCEAYSIEPFSSLLRTLISGIKKKKKLLMSSAKYPGKAISKSYVRRFDSQNVSLCAVLTSDEKISWWDSGTKCFIRNTVLTLGTSSFTLKRASVPCVGDSTRGWKHSFEIVLHINMTASDHLCWFVVSCTISCATTSQRCSTGLDSGAQGGHGSSPNSPLCSCYRFNTTQVDSVKQKSDLTTSASAVISTCFLPSVDQSVHHPSKTWHGPLPL